MKRTGLLSSLPAREDVLLIAQTFRAAGFECYMVGGCVRDLLLGREVKDVDFTTNAHPPEVQRLFKRNVPTGIQHGTITVLIEKRAYEVTTYRAESDYTDARRPDRITFAKTLSEDLSRRDFTINAIAFDPVTEELTDEHGGLEDLAAGRIRTIGKPEDRFFEDGLRTVRACRFASVLGFSIEPETHQALCRPDIHARTKKVAVERFTDELRKGFSGSDPARLVELLEETGLGPLFVPRADPGRIEAINQLSDPENRLAWYLAAAAGDFTDPQTESRIEAIGRSIKLSNDSIAHSVRSFRLLAWKPETIVDIRRFCAWLKKSAAGEFLRTARDFLRIRPDLEEILAKCEEAIARDPLIAKDLALDGNDIRSLGLEGKSIGEAQQAMLELVYEHPEKNTREDLTQFLAGKRSSSS